MADKVQSKPLMYYTDEELISEAKSVYEGIYVSDCYSSSDIMRYDSICSVLYNRGYVINEIKSIEIEKDDDDE